MGGLAARRGERMVRLATLVLALLTFGLAAGPPAIARSFEVNPVNVMLPPDRQTASLTIKNSDTTPVSIRVATFKWTQANGADVYADTHDVIVSPPIFTIAPGATQLVRVGLTARSPGPSAYRLIFEEIPQDRPSGSQIQVALRLNLPLYVLAGGAAKADLSWSAWRNSAGDLFIEGRNRGALHAQVLGLSAQGADGRSAILSQQMGVILPGSVKQWKIGHRSDFVVGAPMLLKVRGPSGDTQAKILVELR